MTNFYFWLWAPQRGTLAVEYAVAVGTLAAAITVAFSGLGGRLIEKLANLPI